MTALAHVPQSTQIGLCFAEFPSGGLLPELALFCAVAHVRHSRPPSLNPQSCHCERSAATSIRNPQSAISSSRHMAIRSDLPDLAVITLFFHYYTYAANSVPCEHDRIQRPVTPVGREWQPDMAEPLKRRFRPDHTRRPGRGESLFARTCPPTADTDAADSHRFRIRHRSPSLAFGRNQWRLALLQVPAGR